MLCVSAALLGSLLLRAPAIAVDSPAAAAEAPAQPTAPLDSREQFIQLAEAYQSGFLQLTALACYQIYSSSGIVATDFAAGYIDAPTAASALDQTALLHSGCVTSVDAVLTLTPAQDGLALAELTKLRDLLAAEDTLLSALFDVFGDPSAEHETAVETARAAVEQQLAAYLGEPAPQ